MATQCYEFVAYLSSLFSVSKQYNILYYISIIYIWGSYIIITSGAQCRKGASGSDVIVPPTINCSDKTG